MRMKMISVPDYVADDFERPLRNPSPAPNAVEKSVERVYRLVNEALKGMDDGLDWEVCNRRYHSSNANEPYSFSRIEEKFYLWSEERGIKAPIAVFKSSVLAAEYFIWLVSKGKREINWEQFLDMEP